MKPRPTPTSPKSRLRTDPVDELFSMKSVIKPTPPLSPYLLITALMAIVISLVSFVGLHALASRYPTNKILRFFSLSSQPNERVVVREISLAKNSSSTEIVQKVLPTLAVLVKTDEQESKPTAERLGLAVFLSADGVAVITASIPTQAKTWLRTENGSTAAVNASAVDSATSLPFLRVTGDSSTLPFLSIDEVTVGMPAYVVRFDPYTGGAGAIMTSVAALRVRPATLGNSAYEESDKITRRLMLSHNFDRTWLGAAVVDTEAKLIGILSDVTEPSGGLVVPVSWLRGQVTGFGRAGKIRRSELGVRYLDLSLTVADEGLPTNGAYLYTGEQSTVAVTPGKPGARAGLREKDVVVAIDQNEIDSRHSLSELLADKDVGSKMILKVQRQGKDIEIIVTNELTSTGG